MLTILVYRLLWLIWIRYDVLPKIYPFINETHKLLWSNRKTGLTNCWRTHSGAFETVFSLKMYIVYSIEIPIFISHTELNFIWNFYGEAKVRWRPPMNVIRNWSKCFRWWQRNFAMCKMIVSKICTLIKLVNWHYETNGTTINKPEWIFSAILSQLIEL